MRKNPPWARLAMRMRPKIIVKPAPRKNRIAPKLRPLRIWAKSEVRLI
jgi:hypothetical protein